MLLFAGKGLDMVTWVPFQRSGFDRLIGWVPDAEAMMLWAGLVFPFPLTKAQLEKHLVYAETHPLYKLLTAQRQTCCHTEKGVA
jgi:hypothetical protein